MGVRVSPSALSLSWSDTKKDTNDNEPDARAAPLGGFATPYNGVWRLSQMTSCLEFTSVRSSMCTRGAAPGDP